MYLKQFVQSALKMDLVETFEVTPLSGYIYADTCVDGEGEEDDKPDWAVETGNAEDVPVDGYPAP